MTHFDIDKYAYLKSPFHSFDPRAKIICFLFLIFSIVLLNDIKVLVIAFISTIVLTFLSKIPLLFILKRFKWVALFIFAVLVVLPFTVPGKTVLSFGFLYVSQEGILLACLISLKAFSVMLLIFPMLSTMKFVTFIKTLEHFKLPKKLVQMISFIYRYAFVVSNEFQRALRSVSSRNVGKKSRILHLHVLSNVIGMTLVRSYERGERIRTAMLSRGYNGDMKTLHSFKMTKKDVIKCSLIIIWSLSLHVIVLTKILDVYDTYGI
ncbi:MAG: cobalt ECF transporter T component CbiQ [Thermoplasmatales archaeon]|nr:cobalt ECF transporter T component CbiQ [Thermoplasmatales archaeon]